MTPSPLMGSRYWAVGRDTCACLDCTMFYRIPAARRVTPGIRTRTIALERVRDTLADGWGSLWALM